MARWWPFRDPVPRLYGYRLDHWHFLGTAEICFANPGADTAWLRANIAFFLSKEDEVRSFKIVGAKSMSPSKLAQLRDHPFHVLIAEQWAIGEHAYWGPVKEPSGYLHDRMWADYGYQWSYEHKRWNLPEKALEAPVREPANTKGMRVRKPKSNLVVVDFTKPPEE